MTPVVDLNVEQAERLCDGFGWFDAGETYCLRPGGAVTTDRGTEILPPGTVPDHAVSQVRFGRLVVEPQADTSVSIFDLRRGQLDETITDPSKTRLVVLGRECVAWLQDDGSGGHGLAVWKDSEIVSWGSVPWPAIETVEDCDSAVIGRGGVPFEPTFYRTTPSNTDVVGSGNMRFDGECSAALDLDGGVIRVACGSAAERIVPLPTFNWDPEYTMLWQFRAEERWSFLVQAAPGVMFGAVRGQQRRARARWVEVHFGGEVPAALMEVRRELCVGWSSNLEDWTGTWRSCASECDL